MSLSDLRRIVDASQSICEALQMSFKNCEETFCFCEVEGETYAIVFEDGVQFSFRPNSIGNELIKIASMMAKETRGLGWRS